MEEDQELRKKAIERLKEANHEKTRAETMGPMGCMKCSLAGTDKAFLMNTIKNTLPSHKGQGHEPTEGNRNTGKARTGKKKTRSTEPSLISTASKLQAQPTILHRGSKAARTTMKRGQTSYETAQRISATVSSHACCYTRD